MTKIEKWAHLAGIVSALAVVISLIYVGYEIRRNTSAVRDDTHQAMLSLGHDWDSWLANKEFAEVVVKATNNYSTLSPSEKLQYDQYVSDGMNLWEAGFYSHRRGMTEDELWLAWDASFSMRFADVGCNLFGNQSTAATEESSKDMSISTSLNGKVFSS